MLIFNRDKVEELVMRSFILMDFGEHVDTSYKEIRYEDSECGKINPEK